MCLSGSVRSTCIGIAFLFSFVLASPLAVHAQMTSDHRSGLTAGECSIGPVPATASAFPAAAPDASLREERCVRTARWVGILSGSTMGLLQMYWSATGVSGVHGPFWKNAVVGIPSAFMGAYVGARSTEWMTREIMEGQPKPGRAALKGAAYGAAGGALTLTTSVLPLLLLGHYLDTIDFNFDDDMIALKIIGASVLGGTLYGGTFGAAAGLVYGPCVSVYMKF